MSGVRFSVFTLAFPGYTAEGAVEAAAKLGFDGVDIRARNDGHVYIDTPREKRRQLVELAESLGISFFGVYSYVGSDLVSPDVRVRERGIEELVKMLDLAVDLGASYVRIFPGTRDRREDNYKRFIESCKAACKEAEDRGVYIGMETHGELAYSADTCNRLMEEVGSEKLVVVYDIAGVYMQGLDPLEEVKGIELGRIIAVQFHDFIKRGRRWIPVLLGKGEIPNENVAEHLRESGYSGFVVEEYEKWWHPRELPDPIEALPRELKYLKRIWGVEG